MRLLFTRRWLLFLAAVAVLAYGCLWLGEWQFGRLHDREDRNHLAEANLHAEPVPLTDVLTTEAPVTKEQEWMRVAATGRYEADDTVIVRYQTRDGKGGVDLVTPLRLADGSAILVDRGWMAAENLDTARADAPAPPTGEVTVTGWVRADGTGSSTKPTNGSVRAISSRAIADTVDYPLLHGFVDAESETPAPADALVPVELPDLGNGPHFFYGLQWWFFGCLAIGGFLYLAYDELRKTRRPAAKAETTDASV